MERNLEIADKMKLFDDLEGSTFQLVGLSAMIFNGRGSRLDRQDVSFQRIPHTSECKTADHDDTRVWWFLIDLCHSLSDHIC